jgi:hypothetical protein
VALRPEFATFFGWPDQVIEPPTVGEALYDLMVVDGWEGADTWRKKANKIAPTLVGGSIGLGKLGRSCMSMAILWVTILRKKDTGVIKIRRVLKICRC